MNIQRVKTIVATAAIGGFLALITSTGFCAQPVNKMQKTNISGISTRQNLSSNMEKTKVDSVRLLVATAWALIDELPVNKEKRDFITKQKSLLKAIKKTISFDTMPPERELQQISRWLLSLHNLALKLDVFGKDTIDMVIFTGNISIAQGYIECASTMARNYK